MRTRSGPSPSGGGSRPVSRVSWRRTTGCPTAASRTDRGCSGRTGTCHRARNQLFGTYWHLPFHGLTGEDRYALYLTANTGFRANALANLTPADFDLNAETP